MALSVLLALAGIVAAVVVVAMTAGRQGNVSHPGVAFIATRPPALPTARDLGPVGVDWPIYGLDEARTRVLAMKTPMRPPFKDAWAVRGRTLIEFTPVKCGRSLYLLKNNGALYKISQRTGRVLWKRKPGALAASSPACGNGAVYAVLLRGRSGAGGLATALSTRDGHVIWSRTLPSRSESSPLLVGPRVYFGSENGTVYALRTRTGSVVWSFHAAGAVKGAIAFDGTRLYFGDYSGAVYALRRTDGHQLWKVSTNGSHLFGIGSTEFYSSPAVAYGRVYIGSTNGAVYSFAANDGTLAWRRETGAYVYASPAVGAVGGGPPTVWIGSYSGAFYALDARSGDVRWSRALGGAISGSASVLGDLVFVSAIGTTSSWALGANTGRTYWKTRRGAFNAAIGDGHRIYFNGYSSLFGLDPR